MPLSKEEMEAKLEELKDDESKEEERVQLQKDLDELLKDDKDANKQGTDDDDKGDKGPRMIPKFRYDTASRRAKEAEERATQLEKALEEAKKTGAPAPAAAADSKDGQSVDDYMAAKDAEYAKLLSEGEYQKAASVMAEIRRVERTAITTYFREQAEDVKDATTQAAALDRFISQVETDIPQLNPDDKEFDEDLSKTVMEVYDGLLAKGDRSPVDSMARALEIVVKQEAAASGEGEDRKAAGLRRNADAARRQAPDMNDHGQDSDKKGQKGEKKDVRELTEEEYDALPESKRRQLRGDFV